MSLFGVPWASEAVESGSVSVGACWLALVVASSLLESVPSFVSTPLVILLLYPSLSEPLLPWSLLLHPVLFPLLSWMDAGTKACRA